MAEPDMEQRKAPRFKASFPVEVGSDGGLTIDLSSTGIAFESSRMYEIGDEVNLRLRLSRGDSPWPMTLACIGHVVRVEEHDGLFTIGATVEWEDESDLALVE